MLQRLLRELRRFAGQVGIDAHDAEWTNLVAQVEAFVQKPARPPVSAPSRRSAAQDSYFLDTLDFIPDAYVVTDQAGVIQQANQSAAEMLRKRREALFGKPLALFAVPEQRRAFYALLAHLRSNLGAVRDWPSQLYLRGHDDPDHRRRHGRARFSRGCGLPEFHWLMRDQTHSLQAEQALQRERAFCSSLLDAAQAYILLLDAKGCIVRSNPYLTSITGYRLPKSCMAMPWITLLGARGSAWLAATQRRQVADLGYNISFFVANWFPGPARGALVQWSAKSLVHQGESEAAVLVLGHDITELQAAHACQALHAERLAAVGQVTATLAHESRNLLQRSQSCLERLSWRLEEQPESLELVKKARQAERELTRLFEDVQSSTSSLQLEWTPCDLQVIWREVWPRGLAPHFRIRQSPA